MPNHVSITSEVIKVECTHREKTFKEHPLPPTQVHTTEAGGRALHVNFFCSVLYRFWAELDSTASMALGSVLSNFQQHF